MKRLLVLLFVACAAAWCQPAQVCVVDTLYSVGVPNLTLMNGYIDLNQGYTGSNGAFVVTQSVGRLTITNGAVNTCQSPGQLQAVYHVQNAGPVAAFTQFTTVWTIPGSGGPYTVQQVLGTRAVSLAWTFGGLLCQATGGATNALSCPGVPAPKQYTPGLAVALMVDAGNGGSATLNINGLGPLPVYLGGLPLLPSTLQPGSGTGNVYPLICDGVRFNVAPGIVPGGAGSLVLATPIGTAGGAALVALTHDYLPEGPPPSSGIYCVTAVNGVVSWVVCGGASALSWTTLSNAQWTGLTDLQWTTLAN